MDWPWADFARMNAHVAHVHARLDLGCVSMTHPFYSMIGESWSNSTGIPWGFLWFHMMGIPLRTPGLLQSHKAS
jgi:hypothetical protein